ncbi:MAG: 2Fe-2S iron-sulfur cluster-binding protein [bacterium]
MSETRDAQTVTIIADGRAVRAAAGISVAAALINDGVSAFRHSVDGADRGLLCGMGICYECRVTIDGVPHRRACLVAVADGLRVNTATEK